MSRDPWLKRLRVAGHDATTLETILADGTPDDGLQHAGQAILRCPRSPGLIASAATLTESLKRRGWAGDPELNAELEHVRDGTHSKLSLVPVELDDVGDALDQSHADVSYIDLTTGITWLGQLFDVGQEPDDFHADDATRWLPVAGAGATSAYAVMERFIDSIESLGLASRLRDAISGPKAFRRFQTELSRHDDEYTRWHRYRADARLGHARAWLAEHGYRSTR